MTTYVVKVVSEIDNSVIKEIKFFDKKSAMRRVIRMQNNPDYALCKVSLEVNENEDNTNN